MNLYIGNLNFKLKESDLASVMEAYGEVSSVKIIKDRETHRSKGYAFVEFADESAARKAIEELDGKDLQGRNMVVKEANPRN